MARLSREESQALTREKLLAAARIVVAREGYENASIDRIAEEAGFSKGAFYSNFQSKEEIFLELLQRHSLHDVEEIRDLVGDSTEPYKIIEIICGWVERKSKDPSWAMLAMELFRRARRDSTAGARHTNLFKAQWRGVGEIVARLFPPGRAPVAPELMGGLVLELTYGFASAFVKGPGASQLVRLALTSMHAAHGAPAAADASRSSKPIRRPAKKVSGNATADAPLRTTRKRTS